jgi:hypothetical protein
VIRAKVRRDGPGEWSWTLLDDHGDLVTGVVGSWDEAIADVDREFQIITHEDDWRDPFEPVPIIAPAVAARGSAWWRKWLALP